MKAHYLSLRPLILWWQAERPIDWAQRFGRDAPLEVEIGFGNGDFLVRRAAEHPECDFVGIEIEWPAVRRALRRIAQSEVNNVRLLQVDARVALERLFEPRSLRRVYSLFPCPWPKERHVGRRLFGRDFLRLVNSRLVEGGEAQVVTDLWPYVDWVLDQVMGTGLAARWQPIPPRFGTKYEAKWRGQGQEQFYDLRLFQVQPVDVPLVHDIPLQPRKLPLFEPGAFRPADQAGEVTVAFKELLVDPQRQKAMLRTVVVEGHLTQHLWIVIERQQDGWWVWPSPGCAWLPTAGLQQALDAVAKSSEFQRNF
ncbi:MAG: tRNA (guanosine(46)-N7)-methyltransferase TrmB [Chloroflexota bacterium]